MRLSALLVAVCLLAQPAFACREGGAAILFDAAPESRPADLTMVHGRFQSSGAIDVAANHESGARKIGPYTQIGVARLDDGETVNVFATLHSCLTGISTFAEASGDFYMVGRLVGETGQRDFLAADRFSNGGKSSGMWTSRPY